MWGGGAPSSTPPLGRRSSDPTVHLPRRQQERGGSEGKVGESEPKKKSGIHRDRRRERHQPSIDATWEGKTHGGSGEPGVKESKDVSEREEKMVLKHKWHNSGRDPRPLSPGMRGMAQRGKKERENKKRTVRALQSEMRWWASHSKPKK